jgi:DinB superfamily
LIARPNTDEYGQFYAGYIARIPEGSDPLVLLQDQRQQIRDLLGGLNDAQARSRYAPDQWSIKEVVGHLTDFERVFGYRTLRISRGDTTRLPGFDQDFFVSASNYDARSLSSLLEEFAALRAVNLMLFESFTPEMLEQRGVASDNPMTPRAIVYIAAGHTITHLDSLRTEYLPALP